MIDILRGLNRFVSSMKNNPRTKHGRSYRNKKYSGFKGITRYVVKKDDLIRKHGFKEKPDFKRHCWLCGSSLNWEGKSVQSHHIFGRAVDEEQHLVHTGCHKRIHKMQKRKGHVISDKDKDVFKKN